MSPLFYTDTELLARFWAGECSPDEAAGVARRLREDAAFAQLDKTLKPLWEAASEPQFTRQADAVMGRVLSHVTAVGTREPVATAKRTSVPVMSRKRVAAWVAAAVVAVAISIPGIQYVLHTTSASVASHQYSTACGERGTFQLPDGSSVLLGPETRLMYEEHANHGERIVRLAGQAYFTVTPKQERPFHVYAGGVVTRVLGTSFTVRAYDGDQVTQVAVAEGRVAVGEGAQSAVLVAGDIAHASQRSAPVIRHDATMADALGWTRGRLAFMDTPLQQIVRELERTYDITIEIADPVLAHRLVTIALVDDAAADAMQAIAIAVDARVIQQNRRVVFRLREGQR